MIKGKETTVERIQRTSDAALMILMVFLCMVGVRGYWQWHEFQEVREEIRQMSSLLPTATMEIDKEATRFDDVIGMIDECVKSFNQEGVKVSSYNLEKISEEGISSGDLRYAQVRFRLHGSWAGVERGLAHIEKMPQRGIHVEGAVLEERGGEILLKIYFLAPDNLT